MSRSVVQEGLPPWLFTKRMAVVGGVVLAVMVNVGFGLFYGARSWWTDFNRAAPACFMYNQTPHEPGKRRFDASDPLPERTEVARNTAVRAVLDAARRCAPDRCISEARSAYAKAIRSYVQARADAAYWVDRRYGGPGLDWALRLYDQLDDRQIVKELRDRHAAGHVDADAMGDYAPAARMLLFRASSEVMPCRQGSS
jgi:hypothetical protein